ncbi:uncharacterized protein LOC135462846 [Liolophura sinensis]|uniref:uncharacterized protein LOC135462846 n=1 Tax=Liolophura sinensis TaxID=3198878 RepID=UPI00315871F6
MLYAFLYQTAQWTPRNVSLTWEVRANDLVSRLALDEIVPQIDKTQPAPAIGIKPYDWDTEYSRENSPSLIFTNGQTTRVEARAKHNNYKAGIYGKHTGLSCFSPVINIMRHPLRGRNQSEYSVINIMRHPLRGSNQKPGEYSVSIIMRHPLWSRSQVSVPSSVLGDNLCRAETSLNGVPTRANKKLLWDVLRWEWGFTGYVVSDEGAVEGVHKRHKYTYTSVQTVAACVNAGSIAVSSGSLSMEKVVGSVKPLFYTRMRLGEFDPPEMNPYTKLDISVIDSPEHVAISREVAIKSIEAGAALLQVVLGQESPAGRLPFTLCQAVGQVTVH